MESRLATILTIVATLIATSLAVYLTVGRWWGFAFAVIGLSALGPFLRLNLHRPKEAENAIGPYLLTIVAVTTLATCRSISGYPDLLAQRYAPLFAPTFSVNETTWFVVFVVAPVSLMLFGGYALSKGRLLGFYMAWWTPLYAIADGFFQLQVETVSEGYDHLFFISPLVAVAQMLAGVVTCQRMLAPHALEPERRTPLTDRQRNLWTVVILALGAVYGVTLYRQAGFLPVGVIIGSMMGGLVAWRKTLSRHPADPARALPLFLLLLGLFYIHVGEEALTHFNRAIVTLTGIPWSDHDFTLLIGLAGPIVWFFAAWSLWKGQPFGNYLFLFMIVGMILGEPAHVVIFPVVAMNRFDIGYSYFSGMYTALFPMIPAVLALAMIIRDERARRAKA